MTTWQEAAEDIWHSHPHTSVPCGPEDLVRPPIGRKGNEPKQVPPEDLSLHLTLSCHLEEVEALCCLYGVVSKACFQDRGVNEWEMYKFNLAYKEQEGFQD